MPTNQDFSGFQNDRQKREREGVRTGGLAPGVMGQGAVAGVASGSFGAQAANPYAGLTQESPMPTGSALAKSSQGPTASGHVNFDQIYNANAATSARKASQLQGNAMARANAVRTGTQAASNQFGQMARSGTFAGPTGAQQNFASQGGGSVAVDPNIPNVGQQAANPRGPNTSDPLYQQIQAGAAGQYAGPNALSDLGVYEQLLKDAGEAQDLSSSLASGNEGIQAQGLNQLDASLVGAAGRKGFAELSRLNGNLKADLEKANSDSVGVADRARQKSKDAAAAYQALLADANKPKTIKPTEQAPTQGTGVHLKDKYKNYDEYMAGDYSLTGDNGLKPLLHQVGTMLSPVDLGIVEWGKHGNNDPVPMEIFRDIFAKGFVGDVSELNNKLGFENISGEYGKEAAEWLWNNMTEQDWASLKTSKNYGYTTYLLQKMLQKGFDSGALKNIKEEIARAKDSGSVKSLPNANGPNASDDDIEYTLATGKPYTDPTTGRTFKTLDEWYTFKRTGK